jgi:hypothetical protein
VKLKEWKLPGSDQIPAELIQAGRGNVIAIHKLINSVWIKEELPDQWKEGTYCFTNLQKGDKTDCSIIVRCYCYQLHTNCIQYHSLKVKLLRIISVGFNKTDQLLIRYFAFISYWRKNGIIMRQCISYS